jgi:L-ribulokinase
MQIYADVTNREINVIGSSQAPALGAAMHAAVAAGEALGGYPDITVAASHMGGLRDMVYKPQPDNVQIYDALYQEYKRLYNYFGRGENNVMKQLRHLKRQVITSPATPDPTQFEGLERNALAK